MDEFTRFLVFFEFARIRQAIEVQALFAVLASARECCLKNSIINFLMNLSINFETATIPSTKNMSEICIQIKAFGNFSALFEELVLENWRFGVVSLICKSIRIFGRSQTRIHSRINYFGNRSTRLPEPASVNVLALGIFDSNA